MPKQCDAKSGPRQIVDPNREEEALAHALVSVTVDDRDRLLGAFHPRA